MKNSSQIIIPFPDYPLRPAKKPRNIVQEPLQPYKKYPVQRVELVIRNHVKIKDRPIIRDSQSAFELFRENWDEDKIGLCEQFSVIYLNRANRVLGLYQMTTGSITGTVVQPQHIIKPCFDLNAVAFIMAHNHPSQSMEPSAADIALTKKVAFGANYYDIKCLDHEIIGDDEYYSLADNGNMPSMH